MTGKTISKIFRTAPDLADQHWRAGLHGKPAARLDGEMTQAIDMGHVWRVNILLQALPQGFQELYHLRRVVEKGNADMFRALTAHQKVLEGRVQHINFPDLAAQHGQAEMLAHMMDNMPALGPYNADTLFRTAAEGGHLPVMRMLLARGSRGGAVLSAHNFSKIAARGDIAVVRAILDSGFAAGDINEDLLAAGVTARSPAIVGLFLSRQHFGAQALSRPLKKAAGEGGEEVVRLLLRAMAHHADRADAKAALDAALEEAAGNGHVGVVQQLLDAGAQINAGGGAALRAAINYDDDTRTVLYLLKAGANPDLTEKRDDDTPLMLAIEQGKKDVVRLLLDHGADHRHNGLAPLQLAEKKGNPAVLALLGEAERARLARQQAEKTVEFDKLFSVGYSVQGLRRTKSLSGEPGLLIAARSGRFAELLAHAGPGGRLRPGDLFYPDHGIDTVYTCLREQGQLAQFFDLRLWAGDKAGMLAAYNMLPEEGKAEVPLAALAAQVHRAEIGRAQSADAGKGARDFKISAAPREGEGKFQLGKFQLGKGGKARTPPKGPAP